MDKLSLVFSVWLVLIKAESLVDVEVEVVVTTGDALEVVMEEVVTGDKVVVVLAEEVEVVLEVAGLAFFKIFSTFSI